MNDEEFLRWIKRLTRVLEERGYLERMRRTDKDREYLPKNYQTEKSPSIPVPYVLNGILVKAWKNQELSKTEVKIFEELYRRFTMAA